MARAGLSLGIVVDLISGGWLGIFQLIDARDSKLSVGLTIFAEPFGK